MEKEQRDKLLNELDEIHKQYSKEPNFDVLAKIQHEQINLVEKILIILSKSNKNETELVWEKACLLSAMGYIQSNKLQNRPTNNAIPSFIWQTIPLVEIELSLTPENQRSQNLNHLQRYESINIQSLLSFCREIKKIT
ncbi:hypothetical protein [Legionella sp.]|uniref:hypothetical protein n=1 Tax=Legionella sp. TaxID=459 RepID=UPI0032203362